MGEDEERVEVGRVVEEGENRSRFCERRCEGG